MNRLISLLLITISLASVRANARVTECEVCESVINKLRQNLPDDAKPEEIELEFKRFCKTATGKDEKFVSL